MDNEVSRGAGSMPDVLDVMDLIEKALLNYTGDSVMVSGIAVVCMPGPHLTITLRDETTWVVTVMQAHPQ